jgi:hypothetical protein
MQSLLLRGFLAAGVLLATVFLVDYAWLRVRIAQGNTRAFDTVQVQVVDEIPQKGNKAEYLLEGMQSETCVRSVFPHSGAAPCWYLKRHAVRQVNF